MAQEDARRPGEVSRAGADTLACLERAFAAARAYLAGLPDRPVARVPSLDALRKSLGGPMPDSPLDPAVVVDDLVRQADPGLVSTAGPRYFGFVTGGALPAATAADWLAAVWDQPASLYVLSPAAAVVEEAAGRWLIDLLGLPPGASAGFVTGCHMANFTALATARLEVLRRAGWDLAENGLSGAPPIRVIVGGEVHVSVMGALRMLGIGARQVEPAASDAEGRMKPEALERLLDGGTAAPTIVCAQSGNVNSGAFDPLDRIAPIARRHGAWLHVDGAFGLWASASAALRHHMRGVELADSWATDAHKWLNVPYDSGLVFTAHPAAHRAAMGLSAAYLVRSGDEPRENMDWTPEASRRARGFAVYAALRSLGRSGVEALVDRCCRLAKLFAARLASDPRIDILNEVVLNQVLVRAVPRGADADEATRA
ncbi:MAG TPA: pyridoxal-dependent decarboxylase, partial [Vicinamibacterales bacterium]|nr:pyridoxal-dependent decarboxylase [Vicinamibacterales bacterium]